MNQSPFFADRLARILIVDDEPANSELLGMILTGKGFLTLTAASGEEALACVARQPPDLILLDIMMPGMNGYQVATRIKDNVATNGIPIIMVSALVNPDAWKLGLNAGAEDFLSKPLDIDDLVFRVTTLLRKTYPPTGTPSNITPATAE